MATTKTVRTYALNGTIKDFTIPFEYLTRKFVVVTLIGATRRELVLNTDYRFSTSNQITTIRGTGWGPADGFDLIEIRRFTSATERLVDFADGSILRAYDLNTSQVQSLHIAEEARDITADTIGVNNDGNLDARARRIVNLGDAIDPGDAVTLRQEKAWGGSASNQAAASAASAAASEVSRQASLAQANASAASASASQTSRLASEAARDLANTYKGNAQTSATNASTYENNSMQWASRAEDSVVSGGVYSSYHYSRKSAASATASATSATASETSNLTSKDWATKAEDSVVAGGLYSSYHYSRKAAASALALGNMTAFNENITQAETSYGVIMKRSFKVTKSIEAGETINAMGKITSQSNIDAAGTINGQAGTYDMGFRCWSSKTFNPSTKLTVGVNSANGQGATIYAPVYENTSVANQNYNSALVVQEAGLRGAGGPAPGHIYNAPSITFMWNGYYTQKLAMDTLGQLTWGSVNGQYCRLNQNGNIYGDQWGGYLTTFLEANYVKGNNFAANVVMYCTPGSVGSYTFGKNVSGSTQGLGVLFPGTSCHYSDSIGSDFGAVAGLWRCMSAVAANASTLFLRIS